MSKVTEKVRRRRKNIVESASNLIKSTKYEKLTIKMICEEADISVGTFYHYFKDKNDLVAGIFELIDDYLEDKVVPLLGKGDGIQDILLFCRGYAEYMTACGVKYSRVINSLFPFVRDVSCRKERQRPLFSILKGLLTQTMEENQLSTSYSAEVLTDMLIVMLRGYCFDWARRGGDYDLVRRTVTCVRIFTNVLRPVPVSICDMEKKHDFSNYEFEEKETARA